MNTLKKNPLTFAKILLIAYFVLNILGEIIYIIDLKMQYNIPITNSLSPYILSLLPTILLAIYVFIFAKKSLSHPLLLVYYIVSLLLNLAGVSSQFNTLTGIYVNYTIQNVINLVFTIIGIALMILCVVDIANKFKHIEKTRKCLLIFYIASTLKIVISIVSNIVNGIPMLYVKSWYIQSLSTIILYITFLVLWFYILKGEPKKEILEDTLINLKSQLNNGIINEEEYAQRKAEILNKL